MSNVIKLAHTIREQEGQLRESSRTVAEVFGKRHDNVIRDIETILNRDPERGLLNFAESEYLNSQGKLQKGYLITRDGLVKLIMGYTGEKASQFQWAYIDAFNEMEQKLNNLGEMDDLSLFEYNLNLLKQQRQAIADNKAQIKLVQADQKLSLDEIKGINEAIAKRRKELGLGFTVKGKFYKKLKAKFLPYGVRSSCTYKDILSKDYAAAVTFITNITKEGLY